MGDRRRVMPSLFVCVLACGPGVSSDDDGGTTASQSSTGSDATSVATTTSQGTESTSSGQDSTDGSSGTGAMCDAPAQYFVPGCEGPSPGDAGIEPGCYVPCDEANPCTEGVCVTAWVDPCYGSPCGACGGQQDLCLDALPTGASCESDPHCSSGVCWNFNDYDECCFGTACTGPCETDQDCITLAEEAGSASPELSVCGPDGRCDALSMGVGDGFACAGPPCG